MQISIINILHVYGKLGDLPWQQDNPFGGVPFGINRDTISDCLGKAIDGIRIVAEEKQEPDKEIKDKAKILLSNANRLLFLGFGYDDFNLSRLDFKDNLDPYILVRGTAFNELPELISCFQERLSRHITLKSGRHFDLYPEDCMNVLLKSRWFEPK